MKKEEEENIYWVASSQKDLQKLPKTVQISILHALNAAAKNEPLSSKTKLLTGIETGVVEIIEDYNKNTYRGVYTTKVQGKIFVLHCFQKKSHKGISTPKTDIDLIKNRLKQVNEYAKGAKNEKQKS